MQTPIYHDPSPRRTRERRSSSRRSYASPLSRSNSNMDSARPTDHRVEGGFTFIVANLHDWLIEDDDLWARLPAQLREELRILQHAGAAALTSCQRVVKLLKDIASNCSDEYGLDAELQKNLESLSLVTKDANNKPISGNVHEHAKTFKDSDDSSSEMASQGETRRSDRTGSVIQKALKEPLDHIEALPSPKYGTVGGTNSIFHYGLATPPITPPETNTGSSTPGFVSPSFSPMSLPQGAQQAATSPTVPSSALESALGSPLMMLRSSSRAHSFSVDEPLSPTQKAYRNEVSELRVTTGVHLRHTRDKIDPILKHAMLSGTISHDDVEAFKLWWTPTKEKITTLIDLVNNLANDVECPVTGLGWGTIKKRAYSNTDL